MDDALILDRAKRLLASLVRGDAVLGILPNAREASEAMMQDLWLIAERVPEAYVLLGRCFYAVLVPDGAFDGVYEGGVPATWPEESLAITDDENAAVEAALRCFFMAAKSGYLASVTAPLVDLGVHSTPENAAIVLSLFSGEPADARETYVRGLLHDAAGDATEAAALHRRAADMGHGQAAATLAVMILLDQIPGTREEAASRLSLAEENGFDCTAMLDAAGVVDPRARV